MKRPDLRLTLATHRGLLLFPLLLLTFASYAKAWQGPSLKKVQRLHVLLATNPQPPPSSLPSFSPSLPPLPCSTSPPSCSSLPPPSFSPTLSLNDVLVPSHLSATSQRKHQLPSFPRSLHADLPSLSYLLCGIVLRRAKKCTTININKLSVPSGKTLDLSDLIKGTQVILQGDVLFNTGSIVYWEGPLFKISGEDVTYVHPLSFAQVMDANQLTHTPFLFFFVASTEQVTRSTDRVLSSKLICCSYPSSFRDLG